MNSIILEMEGIDVQNENTAPKGSRELVSQKNGLAGSYLLLTANKEHSLNIKDLLDNSRRKHLLDLNLSEYVNLNIRAFVIDDVFLRN